MRDGADLGDTVSGEGEARGGIIEDSGYAREITRTFGQRRHSAGQIQTVARQVAIVIDEEERVLRMKQLRDFKRPAEAESEATLRIRRLSITLAVQRKRRRIESRVTQVEKERASNLPLARVPTIADEAAAPAWTPRTAPATGTAKSTAAASPETTAAESSSAKTASAEPPAGPTGPADPAVAALSCPGTEAPPPTAAGATPLPKNPL